MKKIFFILIFLCVSLTAYVIVAKTPKEQSLQHDILNNIQLSKVKANTLISPEDQIYQITSDDSSALLSLVESMSVKKQKSKTLKTTQVFHSQVLVALFNFSFMKITT